MGPGASGPTIFVALPNHWSTIFALAISLTGQIGIVLESSAYLISVYALALPDVPVRKALCEYAQSLTVTRLGSHYTCTATVGIAAQTHVSHAVKLRLLSEYG